VKDDGTEADVHRHGSTASFNERPQKHAGLMCRVAKMVLLISSVVFELLIFVLEIML